MLGRSSREKEKEKSNAPAGENPEAIKPPAGWYADPDAANSDGTRARWWDGEQWTETVSPGHTAEAPQPAQDAAAQPDSGPAAAAVPDRPAAAATGHWIQPPPPSQLRIMRIQEGPQAGETTIGDAGVILNTVRRVAQDSRVYVPASVVDVAQHRGLTIGAVSVRGLGHQDFGLVRQDAVAFATAGNSRFIVGTIADGVSEAPNSHAGADSASKAALASVREFLDAGTRLHEIPWPEVTETVRNNLRKRAELAFGAKLRNEKVDDGTWARQVGTTAEVLIVDSEPAHDGSFEYVRAVLAGDGYGYVISPAGLLPLGSGKARDNDLKSNKVLPLPSDPGPGYPHVQPGRIRPGEAVMITTDGIGDDMADGTTEVAGYMHAELLQPRTPHSLLETVSYVAYQSDDDRTVLVVWA